MLWLELIRTSSITRSYKWNRIVKSYFLKLIAQLDVELRLMWMMRMMWLSKFQNRLIHWQHKQAAFCAKIPAGEFVLYVRYLVTGFLWCSIQSTQDNDVQIAYFNTVFPGFTCCVKIFVTFQLNLYASEKPELWKMNRISKLVEIKIDLIPMNSSSHFDITWSYVVNVFLSIMHQHQQPFLSINEMY